MEEEEEEVVSLKCKSSTTTQTLSPPWVDLPEPITELILEHLPLLDYLRFPSVCRKWRSIQRDHGLLYSPSQPPMSPPLPWLIPTVLGEDPHLHCYSPFNQTSYRLRQIYTTYGGCMFSCHGWILSVNIESSCKFSLINPVTSVTIELPFLSFPPEFLFDGSAAMSAPPTHSSCTILLVDQDYASLYRVNGDGHRWSQQLHLPLPTEIPRLCSVRPSAVFSGGRFYYVSGSCCFYIIDPALPNPSVRILEMDTSQIPWEGQWTNFLAEFDGEVVLVVMQSNKSLQVFRPDFPGKMWVRVDRLGDRALFIHYNCSFSLPASNMGCKKNCIYYPKSLQEIQKERSSIVAGDLFAVFDLETGRLIDD